MINNLVQEAGSEKVIEQREKKEKQRSVSNIKKAVFITFGVFFLLALIYVSRSECHNSSNNAVDGKQFEAPSSSSAATIEQPTSYSLQKYVDTAEPKISRRSLFQSETDPKELAKIRKKLKEKKKNIFEEQNSQRYMEYSKANQRKADKKRRQQRIRKEMQDNNILKDIKKNPYLDDQYSYLTKQDVKRVKKWRYMVGQDFSRPSVLADEQKKYYTDKYHIDQYEQLPFCIIVPTFNNKPRKRAERNLRSILMQDYKNFHLVIIDDGSADGTGTMLANMLKQQTTMDPSRYEVIIHTDRYYSVANIRNASRNFCTQKDIVIIVDGDDELLGRQVLSLFNAVFQQKGVWYLYTNFLGSIGKVGYSRPYHPSIIEANSYREYSFAVSHLRAYYNKLLLNIKDEDLQDQNGKYFTSAGDMAIAIPCLEQAHRRVMYLPQMTYYYNFNTGLNVHKKRLNQQRQNNLKIRAKTPYKPLDKLF